MTYSPLHTPYACPEARERMVGQYGALNFPFAQYRADRDWTARRKERPIIQGAANFRNLGRTSS